MCICVYGFLCACVSTESRALWWLSGSPGTNCWDWSDLLAACFLFWILTDLFDICVFGFCVFMYLCRAPLTLIASFGVHSSCLAWYVAPPCRKILDILTLVTKVIIVIIVLGFGFKVALWSRKVLKLGICENNLAAKLKGVARVWVKWRIMHFPRRQYRVMHTTVKTQVSNYQTGNLASSRFRVARWFGILGLNMINNHLGVSHKKSIIIIIGWAALPRALSIR